MGRLIHFEIHVSDMERAKKFYGEVFGWSFQDWGDFTGMPYFGAITGDEDELGINGALVQRYGEPPEAGQALNAFVCTIAVKDYDSAEARILAHGGQVAMPKTALTGIAWQGYYFDAEGNLFGIHQQDVKAR
ncbi:MAG: VOC family protein [Syntrophomonadaceae bacterium]